MNETERAINDLKDFVEADIGEGNLHMSSVGTALTALREKAEREKGCEYCTTPACETCIHDGSYEYCSCLCRGISHYEPINFCPMCGRKL